MEQTGLIVTDIIGEKKIIAFNNGYGTINYLPFCSPQNLFGGYSIILQTFICHAEGESLKQTEATINIRWELLSDVEKNIRDEY